MVSKMSRFPEQLCQGALVQPCRPLTKSITSSSQIHEKYEVVKHLKNPAKPSGGCTRAAGGDGRPPENRGWLEVEDGATVPKLEAPRCR